LKKKDKLTPEDALVKRHAFLVDWLKRIQRGEDEGIDA
jgi:hypothetical protein